MEKFEIKTLSLKINLSHAICICNNEDTFFSIFSLYIFGHTVGQLPIYTVVNGNRMNTYFFPR